MKSVSTEASGVYVSLNFIKFRLTSLLSIFYFPVLCCHLQESTEKYKFNKNPTLESSQNAMNFLYRTDMKYHNLHRVLLFWSAVIGCKPAFKKSAAAAIPSEYTTQTLPCSLFLEDKKIGRYTNLYLILRQQGEALQLSGLSDCQHIPCKQALYRVKEMPWKSNVATIHYSKMKMTISNYLLCFNLVFFFTFVLVFVYPRHI